MIVTTAEAHAVARSASGMVGRRCLARRGMLHSECEAVDHVRLEPGATVEDQGRAGIDEAWFVLSGALDVDCHGHPPFRLGEGELLICPAGGRRPRLRAANTAADLLMLAVLPAERARNLPARQPEVTVD